MELNEYLDLITSEHRQKPNYIAVVTANLQVPLRVQDLMAAMIPLFDVDVAIGDQLDIIGEWVGITRNVSIPIDGVYFAWDDEFTVGWEYGSWQPHNTPVDITSLPDDAYRTLIKAKIAANSWDGTTDGAYDVWESIFTNFTILIQDHQDMSYALAIVGGIVDSLTLALLLGGYIPLKPEGVRVTDYYVPVDTNPAFAWDVESEFLAGWEEGSWLRQIPAE